ncbi:MAG: GNAT family N-acetyltransferase [Acidimicrobiales bacterium]
MPTIRRLRKSEWRLLRAVRLHALQDAPFAFGSSFGEEADQPDDWWVAGYEHLAWFVAEDEGNVVGLVGGLAAEDEGSRPEIISMWVDGDHRATHVAIQLLEAVLDWARSSGYDEIVLAVAADNDRARRFYERAGFRLTGSSEPLRSRPSQCTQEMVLEL